MEKHGIRSTSTTASSASLNRGSYSLCIINNRNYKALQILLQSGIGLTSLEHSEAPARYLLRTSLTLTGLHTYARAGCADVLT